MKFTISIIFLLLVALISLAYAGPGAHVNISNRSGYNFKKIHQHSYKMSQWDFPDTINNNEQADIYVEFDYTSTPNEKAGEVYYQLEGTNHFFKFGAKHQGGPHLYAKAINLASNQYLDLVFFQNVFLYIGVYNNGKFSFINPMSKILDKDIF